jgi:hypothetical protein
MTILHSSDLVCFARLLRPGDDRLFPGILLAGPVVSGTTNVTGFVPLHTWQAKYTPSTASTSLAVNCTCLTPFLGNPQLHIPTCPTSSGSTVRESLLLSYNGHQFMNVAVAGVRTPRASTKPGKPSEQQGEEVTRTHTTVLLLRPLTLDVLRLPKFFTGSGLLQPPVRETLLSLPESKWQFNQWKKAIPLSGQYIDLIISDVRTANGRGVQILNTQGKTL